MGLERQGSHGQETREGGEDGTNAFEAEHLSLNPAGSRGKARTLVFMVSFLDTVKYSPRYGVIQVLEKAGGLFAYL